MFTANCKLTFIDDIVSTSGAERILGNHLSSLQIDRLVNRIVPLDGGYIRKRINQIVG